MVTQIERQDGVCPCKSACSCSCQGLGFCDCLGRAVGLHLHESTEKSPPVTDPPTILSPRAYAISTPSGDVVIEEDLCDIMLRPVREVRGERKCQRNRDLDPGNQCITGKVFLDAINSEKERKRREQEEKEEKKKERARLAEEKKRKLEERKEKKKREKEAKSQKAAKKGEKNGKKK